MKSTCKATMQLFNFKLWMVLCTVLAAATRSSAESHQFACPPFWVPFQESCYRIFGTKLNWTAAEESCNTHFNGVAMGHLVSPQSEDENRFVSQLWDSATGGMTAQTDYTYWIGLTDAAVEGEWVWTDNNQLATFTSWNPGQPDNYNNNEHCAHQWNRVPPAFLTWNDLPCSFELFYVCELPQNK